jgi:WxcM-like, C-terminal
MYSVVSDLSTVAFPLFIDERGSLGVAELQPLINFAIRRVFWISDVPRDGARGGHAHKQCNQFMICLAGSVSVEAFDGESSRTLALPAGNGIHIPPGIYAIERFDEEGSLLTVLCDLPFEKADYIYDRSELVAFRNRSGA